MFKGGGIGALFGGRKPDDGGAAPSPGGGRGPRVAGIGALLGSPDTRRGTTTPTRRAAPAPEIPDGDMPALFSRAQDLLDKTNRRAELGSRTVRPTPPRPATRVGDIVRGCRTTSEDEIARRELRPLDATRRPPAPAPRLRPTDSTFPPPRPRRAARGRQPTVHARQRDQAPGRSPSRGDPESPRRGRTRRVDRAARLPRGRHRLGGGARDRRRRTRAGTRRATRAVLRFAEPLRLRRARGRHVRGPRRVPRARPEQSRLRDGLDRDHHHHHHHGDDNHSGGYEP
jgi:hypothetical protein